MKKNFITFSILFLFILMLSFPAVTRQAATTGLNLWLYTILPALLPYTIISSLLLYLDAFAIPGRIFEKILKRKLPDSKILIVIFGYLCGCPIGARLASDSYKAGKISKKSAELLMCYCNNLSPSFLINYVFVEIYTSFVKLSGFYKWIIYLIMIFSSILGSLTADYIFKKASAHKALNDTSGEFVHSEKQIFTREKPAFSKFFEDCILSAFEIQAKIGGYIILFTIISNLFLHTLNLSPLQAAALGSMLEVTSGLGLFLICGNIFTTLPQWFVPALITALTTFGGLCTIFQTKSAVSDSGLSVAKYGVSKLISGFLAFVMSIILFHIQ